MILEFSVKHFREDLRKILGMIPADIEFRWDQGFEEFLRERKKRMKIKSEGTMKYYRNLFKKHLEGKVLSQDLIDYVINYPVKWLRNVFRHYVQYLYYTRKISPETYGWIMEVVPSRSYKMDVRPYPINIEDLIKTMDFLRERHGKYYVVYRAMLEGGLRLSHTLHMIKTFSPEEVIEIPNTAIVTKRLVCFDSFCRYYVGIRETMKPCEWAYLSKETVEMIREISGALLRRQVIQKYAREHGLLPPKTMRKIAWRTMIKAMPREVARFIQSRFGELRVSEARYEDLLSEADQHYSKYLEKLWEELMAD
jgi:intergrase/recombinase